jgi:D-tagatose-1,6-bisphosphate aldolase subunit GatZ/KbaZ
MLANPRWWSRYYGADATEQRLGRGFSLSDRCRYYWAEPTVSDAVGRLLRNLRHTPPPPTLLSQFMPLQYAALRLGHVSVDPADLIRHKVDAVLERYASASGQELAGLRQIAAFE